MDLIYDILKKLKNYEIRQIRNQLKSSPFEYEKVGKLFDLVTRYKDKDETFFSEKLYNKPPDNTFRVTKSRLKRMLEDVVLNDKSLNSYSAQYINAFLQAKKRLLQGEILLGRGIYSGAKNLLLQVVSQAQKFSLHNELFHSELLLLRGESINMKVKEFQKRSDMLLELNRENYLVNEAAILHYSVTNLLTNKTLVSKESMEEILVKLDKIREVKEITKSPVAEYYYLLTNILYAQYESEFNEAKKYCKAYLRLLQTQPSVRSDQRLGSALFQLTEVSLRTNDLEEARKYVKETLSFFSREETNYLIVLGSAFRAAFYSENYGEANKIIQEAFAHPRFEISKMRTANWHFFKACLQFKTGKVKEAMQELNGATEMLSDKMGWNISFRLLEIMLLYEADLHDLLDTKILNMRQFVKRTHKNSELYRPMLLIGILMEWHKKDLDFKKAMPGISKKLEQLAEYHKKVPFNPTATELIRLETWIEEKARQHGAFFA
ncbi:MAG: hypothetical protein H6581_19295 [Bacteroidia bacterium]|nr:hypothetical protein [Bacteroidia bacterium]